MALEIAALLATAVIDDRALQESDIAVLVRRNSEAKWIKRALTDKGIPAVIHNTETLFDTIDAVDMENVLSAIVSPANASRVRTALATGILGLSGEAIDALNRNESKWEARLITFRQYHELWQHHGFIGMLKTLFRKENVLSRLMQCADGERRCTNLLHLTEVLHQVWVSQSPGMAGLVRWLGRQRQEGAQTPEEYQLRLETDDNAVKIVTIHKSKGLEYPVVFCPFVWNDAVIGKTDDPVSFHDPDHGYAYTLDMGSDDLDAHRTFAAKELLAENLRLFYVAVTRARHRCCLVWGKFKGAEYSAPAYLLHQDHTISPEDDSIQQTIQRYKSLTHEDIVSDLKIVADRAGGAINISEMTVQEQPQPDRVSKPKPSLAVRTFKGGIERNFGISSFSSLVSRQSQQKETPDHDAGTENPPEALMIVVEPQGIFAFPKGAVPGIFMHDIFEHLDFTSWEQGTYEPFVRDKLIEYDFDSAHLPVITGMVQNVLTAPLMKEMPDFTLSAIPWEKRLNELEFYFPLASLCPKTLKAIFLRHLAPNVPDTFIQRIGGLSFSAVRGFMKGFVDMIFEKDSRWYIVDWKSNYLGPQPENYNQAALSEVMVDKLYTLQYLLYTVALHQYLRIRIHDYTYDTHFGGVYYIFLRGVVSSETTAENSEFGIFYDRPSRDLIEDLSETLIPEPLSGEIYES